MASNQLPDCIRSPRKHGRRPMGEQSTHPRKWRQSSLWATPQLHCGDLSCPRHDEIDYISTYGAHILNHPALRQPPEVTFFMRSLASLFRSADAREDRREELQDMRADALFRQASPAGSADASRLLPQRAVAFLWRKRARPVSKAWRTVAMRPCRRQPGHSALPPASQPRARGAGPDHRPHRSLGRLTVPSPGRHARLCDTRRVRCHAAPAQGRHAVCTRLQGTGRTEHPSPRD